MVKAYNISILGVVFEGLKILVFNYQTIMTQQSEVMEQCLVK